MCAGLDVVGVGGFRALVVDRGKRAAGRRRVLRGRVHLGVIRRRVRVVMISARLGIDRGMCCGQRCEIGVNSLRIVRACLVWACFMWRCFVRCGIVRRGLAVRLVGHGCAAEPIHDQGNAGERGPPRFRRGVQPRLAAPRAGATATFRRCRFAAGACVRRVRASDRLVGRGVAAAY